MSNSIPPPPLSGPPHTWQNLVPPTSAPPRLPLKVRRAIAGVGAALGLGTVVVAPIAVAQESNFSIVEDAAGLLKNPLGAAEDAIDYLQSAGEAAHEVASDAGVSNNTQAAIVAGAAGIALAGAGANQRNRSRNRVGTQGNLISQLDGINVFFDEQTHAVTVENNTGATLTGFGVEVGLAGKARGLTLHIGKVAPGTHRVLEQSDYRLAAYKSRVDRVRDFVSEEPAIPLNIMTRVNAWHCRNGNGTPIKSRDTGGQREAWVNGRKILGPTVLALRPTRSETVQRTAAPGRLPCRIGSCRSCRLCQRQHTRRTHAPTLVDAGPEHWHSTATPERTERPQPLVLEVSFAGHDHGDAVFIGGGDYFVVS